LGREKPDIRSRRNALIALFILFTLVLGLVAFYVSPVGNKVSSRIASCEAPSDYIVPPSWKTWRSTQSSGTRNHVAIPEFYAAVDNQIENIKNGVMFVDRRGPIQKLSKIGWDDESHGNYYATQLHGLVGIGTLLHQNEKMPTQVEHAIGTHIQNWALCSAHNPSINSRSWYEGTVIKRLSNLLKASEYLDKHASLGNLSRVELDYLIDFNANYLLDTPEIYFLGNHGIRQDMVLAAAALLLPEHPRSNQMLKLAENRLETAATELFTEEGIWKEHAPGYVYYALWLIDSIKALDNASGEFNPSKFVSRYDSSLQYLLSVLLPNGDIPYIGSSGASELRIQNQQKEKVAETNSRTVKHFPDYGHAVVRGDYPDGLYLLFVASQNLPAGKRHADDLSFILYKHGRAWITEGGHQTYGLTNMTKYIRSPFAHNTYTLDDRYIAEDARPDLAVRLLDVSEDKNRITLRGETERFHKPAKFKREVEIIDYSKVVLRDTLAGKGKWQGRLQLPGDLSVAIEDDLVIATSHEGHKMYIKFSSDQPYTLSTCHGQKKPICGWANPAHNLGQLPL